MQKRKLRKAKVPKELLEPIVIEALPRPSLIDVDDSKARTEAEKLYILEQQMAKLFALAKHYKLDTNSTTFGLALSFQLASDFFPGFQIKRKSPGAPTRWSKAELFLLWYEIQLEVKQRKTAHSVCRKLASQPIWRKKIKTNDRVKAGKQLYDQYQLYKKSAGFALMRKLNAMAESHSHFNFFAQAHVQVKDSLLKNIANNRGTPISS